MKTKNLFTKAILIAAAMAMTSCGNDIEPYNNTDLDPDPVAVKFTSNIISSILRTTNGGDSWVEGDVIGIKMAVHGTPLSLDQASNVPYKVSSIASGKAHFSAVNNEIYYPNISTPYYNIGPDGPIPYYFNGLVDFLAFYPYSDNAYPISINVIDQNTPANIDLMFAYSTNNSTGYSQANNTPVELNFEHLMAKLSLTVVGGAGVTNLSGLQVTLKGFTNTADNYGFITFMEQKFDASGSRPHDDITPLTITSPTSSTNGVYEAILIPSAYYHYNNTAIEFVVGGDTYTWKISDDIASLESGKKYSYTISLQKQGIEANGSITPWTDTPGSITLLD